MKRLNGKRWTPWVEDRHLPIQRLPNPSAEKSAIWLDWNARKMGGDFR